MSRIHYTNHVCVVATGKNIYLQARERGRDYDVNSEHARYTAAYPSTPHPEGGAECRERRAKRFTVDSSQVTCRWCLKSLAYDTLDRFEDNRKRNPIGSWRNWASHDERTERAWLMCCRDHGHAYPFTDEKLAAFQRQQLAGLIAKHIDLGSTFVKMPRTIRDLVAASWPAIPDELREPMRAAIDEMTMATDLLEEVDRMFARARAAIARVAADVATGRLVVDAASAIAHVTAAAVEIEQRRAA